MRMVRKALNLLVDEDLVNKAREHGLNLSKFFENQLRGYFNLLDGRQQFYYNSNDSNNNESSQGNDKTGLLRGTRINRRKNK